jgi:hypothetical protein
VKILCSKTVLLTVHADKTGGKDKGILASRPLECRITTQNPRIIDFIFKTPALLREAETAIQLCNGHLLRPQEGSNTLVIQNKTSGSTREGFSRTAWEEDVRLEVEKVVSKVNSEVVQFRGDLQSDARMRINKMQKDIDQGVLRLSVEGHSCFITGYRNDVAKAYQYLHDFCMCGKDTLSGTP